MFARIQYEDAAMNTWKTHTVRTSDALWRRIVRLARNHNPRVSTSSWLREALESQVKAEEAKRETEEAAR